MESAIHSYHTHIFNSLIQSIHHHTHYYLPTLHIFYPFLIYLLRKIFCYWQRMSCSDGVCVHYVTLYSVSYERKYMSQGECMGKVYTFVRYISLSLIWMSINFCTKHLFNNGQPSFALYACFVHFCVRFLSPTYHQIRTPHAPLQVVSLHCNLDDSTRHLINTETLNMMKPDAVLVNAARGPCINEAALL